MFIQASLSEFIRYKTLAEGALAQVSDPEWFYTPNTEANCLAIIVKHVAGNLRSRWADFLSSDGEKPDRQRDTEFELSPTDTVPSLRISWEESWRILMGTLEKLTPEDLSRTVTIRGQPHSVVEATQRSITHIAYHVGQIVQLAKILRGPGFKNLSIPKGQSQKFIEEMRKKYRPS